MSTQTLVLNSQNHWLADGSQTVWNFSFAGGYISRSHVKAYTSTPEGVRTYLSLDDSDLIGPYQLQVTPAVADGDTIVIYRETPIDGPIVNFEDGGAVDEINLDIVAKQAIFAAAEAADNQSVLIGEIQTGGTIPITGLIVSNTPAGTIGSTNVQAAINELDSDRVAAAAALAATGGAALVGASDGASGTMWTGLATFITYVQAAFGSTLRFLQAGTGAVARLFQSKARERVSVKDFGAVGDGVTNDRLAIFAAATYLNGRGGGDLIFPDGATYAVSGVQSTVTVKELDATLQYADSTLEAQLYFDNFNNINFIFEGATLASTKTDGGATLVFDGCSKLVFTNLKMLGQTVMSGSTVVTVGTEAVAFLSKNRNTDGVTFTAPVIDGHYSSIDILGDPASIYRVQNVTVSGQGVYKNGYYGLACRGNGVNVRATSGYSYKQNRPFFIYDTEDVHIGMVGDDMNGGFQSIVKAYTANTTDIKINFVVKNRANTQNRLNIQSQHNQDVQATPAYLKNIDIDYTEVDSVGGDSVLFEYYRKTVLTASSASQLFTNITLRGTAVGNLTTGVQLTSASNPCVLNKSNFFPANGDAIYASGNGFVPAQSTLWTPTDASGATLTFTTTASNNRYVIGPRTFASFAITYPVTASGSSASITGLPIKSASTASSVQGGNITYTDAGAGVLVLLGANSTTINFYKLDGTSWTNAGLSGKTLRGYVEYASA